MNKVVVTFTSLPSRLKYIEPLVQSMMDQSYADFELHLNIPDFSELEQAPYVLPEWMQKYPKLQVFVGGIDWGSHTKLVPTLKRISDPDTIIITVDDDLIYHTDTVKNHIELRRDKYPEAAIGFAGISSLDIDKHYCSSMEYDTRVRILEGYKSVSYLRKFFDPVYYAYARLHWCDDTTISCMLGRLGIEKYCCHWPGEQGLPSWQSPFEPSADGGPIIGKLCHNYPTSGCKIRKNDSDKMGVRYSVEVFNEWIAAGWYDAGVNKPRTTQ